MGNGGILVAEIDGDVKSIGDIKIKNYSDGKWKEYELKIVNL